MEFGTDAIDNAIENNTILEGLMQGSLETKPINTGRILGPNLRKPPSIEEVRAQYDRLLKSLETKPGKAISTSDSYGTRELSRRSGISQERANNMLRDVKALRRPMYGTSVGTSLIAALLATKPELEGVLQDYLGLNEQEVWHNPEASSYETAPLPQELDYISPKKMY